MNSINTNKYTEHKNPNYRKVITSVFVNNYNVPKRSNSYLRKSNLISYTAIGFKQRPIHIKKCSKLNKLVLKNHIQNLLKTR